MTIQATANDDAAYLPLNNANAFTVEDLMVFDPITLRESFAQKVHTFTAADLATALHGTSATLRERIAQALPKGWQREFEQATAQTPTQEAIAAQRRAILDAFFWELIYWRTPERYDALIAGERLHPDIFTRLAPDLAGKVVADLGAGSGRATFPCLRLGVQQPYAVEPAPPMLALLRQKLREQAPQAPVIPLLGSFSALPLATASVDAVISCAAFTIEDEATARRQLAEIRRVIRPTGKLIFIWPRPRDLPWLLSHGFQYEAVPLQHEMAVQYPSVAFALDAARTYYRDKPEVAAYVEREHTATIPYAVLRVAPPNNYCWLTVAG